MNPGMWVAACTILVIATACGVTALILQDRNNRLSKRYFIGAVVATVIGAVIMVVLDHGA